MRDYSGYLWAVVQSYHGAPSGARWVNGRHTKLSRSRGRAVASTRGYHEAVVGQWPAHEAIGKPQWANGRQRGYWPATVGQWQAARVLDGHSAGSACRGHSMSSEGLSMGVELVP